MTHTLSKSLLIIKVIELIAEKYSISIEEARNKLYSSELINLIDDDETGLYGESPLYVFSLFEQEIKNANWWRYNKLTLYFLNCLISSSGQ